MQTEIEKNTELIRVMDIFEDFLRNVRCTGQNITKKRLTSEFRDFRRGISPADTYAENVSRLERSVSDTEKT